MAVWGEGVKFRSRGELEVTVGKFHARDGCGLVHVSQFKKYVCVYIFFYKNVEY